MEAAGGDGEMQIDFPVQRGEHAERAVRVVAGSRADARGDFALEHQHHSRNHARVVAQLAQDCSRDVERKIADYLYRRIARECREIDLEKVGVDDANVCEALLEPRREARVEFHQRQRASWLRRDFLSQDAEAGTYLDYRIRFAKLRRVRRFDRRRRRWLENSGRAILPAARRLARVPVRDARRFRRCCEIFVRSPSAPNHSARLASASMLSKSRSPRNSR